MKMQTVVAAAALALALSARADQWFDAGIANIDDWPDTAGWTNTGNTTYTNETISLEGASGLTYTASPTKTLGSSEAVTVTTTMKLTAYDADDLPDVPEDAKAAIIAVNDDSVLSYKGLAKVESANGWVALSGATPTEDASVDISISLLDGKVRYKVGDAVLTSGNAEWLDVVASGTVSNVVYKGTGDISALSGTTEPPTATVVLDWPAGYTAMSYQVGEGTPVSITGTSPGAVSGLPIGTVVTFVVQNADGAQKTLTGTAGTDSKIDAAEATFTWADYLGEADNGAYTIDDANDLDMLRKGVDAGIATTGETFKLTADIALDAPWPGIGVQNGKDIYSTDNFNAAAFCGTFDGQNHTISGFQMVGKGDKAEGLDYCGFFNSTYSATIQNLKIAYAGSLFAADTTASTKESGATFVGVAKNSTLRNLTTVAGTVSCSKGFGGIVGYLTSGTLVDSCTNNLNMTSLAGNKCGGIAMITQGGSAVTIRNCQNNGTQTTSSSNSEFGAIVGYVGLDTTIADCETTVGRFLKHQTGTVTLQGVNKGDARVASYHGAATPGLNFATVDGTVATFVADNALAAGNTYLLTAQIPASAAPVFTLTAVGQAITFDEAVGCTNVAGMVGYSGAAGAPAVTTSGTEVTYTSGYFPRTATAGQDGSAANPFEIADEDDLLALQAYVTTTNCTGLSFVQTADIDMASAGAFAGIGTYAKVPTAGTPFLGTYDGKGFKISNVTRAAGNTVGIFNQVGPSGVIENLVVENMSFDGSLTGEYGCAIVGNAGGGATLRNLTATGTFGSALKPSTHNMAGIVVRLSPGATAGAATTIDSCTNNATIYGAYTKLGGINAIVQNQTGFKDGKVVFVNCANNGTLVCKRTKEQAEADKGAITGQAGIVGYITGTNVELTGCYGNGAITNEDGANTDKDGALVGWTYGGTIKDNGGNAAPAGKKMIGAWGGATETGFLYATVADGVATTISGSIAAGGSYLLEGNAAPTIALAKDESIAFDTALGYTLTDTGITAAEGLTLTDETVGTVTTYTAKADEGWTDDPITPGTSAATQYPALANTALATADAGKLTAWATKNNVEFSSVKTDAGDYVEAFLLNCAPADVETAKEAFKVTITVNADGTVTVTAPDSYNVTPKIQGKQKLSDAEWHTKADGDKFFRAVLEL